jgi:hypothetical protein
MTRSGLLVGPLLLAGCFATAATPALIPSAQAVQTGKGAPLPGMRELGPIEAVHGSGCGALGTRGTFEGANAMLRNQAAIMGATYVQVFMFTEPHDAGGCYDDRFVIRGMAYQAPTTPNLAAPVAWPPLPGARVSGHATCVAEGRTQPGVVVQAENAYGMDVVGFRPLSGGKGLVAQLQTRKLLGQIPPPR